MGTRACSDCDQPLQFAYDTGTQRWLPLDAQVVDGDDNPAIWLLVPTKKRPEARRPMDVGNRLALTKGISEIAGRALALELYEAHFDHRDICPVRQARQERRHR